MERVAYEQARSFSATGSKGDLFHPADPPDGTPCDNFPPGLSCAEPVLRPWSPPSYPPSHSQPVMHVRGRRPLNQSSIVGAAPIIAGCAAVRQTQGRSAATARSARRAGATKGLCPLRCRFYREVQFVLFPYLSHVVWTVRGNKGAICMGCGRGAEVSLRDLKMAARRWRLASAS